MAIDGGGAGDPPPLLPKWENMICCRFTHIFFFLVFRPSERNCNLGWPCGVMYVSSSSSFSAPGPGPPLSRVSSPRCQTFPPTLGPPTPQLAEFKKTLARRDQKEEITCDFFVAKNGASAKDQGHHRRVEYREEVTQLDDRDDYQEDSASDSRSAGAESAHSAAASDARSASPPSAESRTESEDSQSGWSHFTQSSVWCIRKSGDMDTALWSHICVVVVVVQHFPWGDPQLSRGGGSASQGCGPVLDHVMGVMLSRDGIT